MADTDVVRRFNRTYTQRIGALDESFLGLGLPLGLARLVFEVGTSPDGLTALGLRSRLGLDSGHLARQLRSLEERGLVDVRPDPADRRRRVVALTRSGWALRDRLDARSERLAARLVEPLTERQRARLTEALATADLLVRAATVDIRTVDPTEPAAVEAMDSYFAELDRRFPDGFDPGPAEVGDMVAATGGAFVLATSDGGPVASGGIRSLGPEVGEIKRMWVHDEWRGAGLGSRLLRHLEATARDLGHRTVRLDTNRTLTEAIAMYDRAGYRPIERYNDNPYAQAFFEKALDCEVPEGGDKVRRP
ncbi:helix-turn-helix domain-containing GNAT family N-acetyltransferase [Nocardioides sp.]|uniref:bifunctional helix-turn-helix transcriptional regulator/GNAT family N-acetyltransferase n=1 Tax=Nocardioides sp. TaxID=35761 RepID=UPI001A2205FE|nr:helix-turn-helix domain-containing GNAT family N-acetyltransferase [Nocardioides sp.]MBJ7356787.1 MarR family transcriptional regulator [Nocardioides sp.]